MGDRIAALDRLRGIVMVLMAVDHASVAFDAGRLAHDSAAMWVSGEPLPAARFFTRVVTHLCAPTFVALAGAGIALAARRPGADPRRLDRDLLVRGSMLVALDALVMSRGAGLTLLLQVLFALGVGMILMVPLRRLGPWGTLALGIAWLAGGEWITARVWDPASPTPVVAALVGCLDRDDLVILYPAIPWTALMALGYALGDWLGRRAAAGRPRPVGALAAIGLLGLSTFVLVRGANGYGNMFLPRDDGSIVQWLHVSKYPPSLAFCALELGLGACLLSALLWRERSRVPGPDAPLVVFGQSALFFYFVHFGLLVGAGTLLDPERGGGLPATWGAAALCVIALYLPCRRFRDYKRAHPRAWVRYI
jgi:uncharacterized membrane protein